MKYEIERKYLVKQEQLPNKRKEVLYIQGYISNTSQLSLRVRLAGKRGYLTLKKRLNSVKRFEYEYCIPYSDAKDLLRIGCKNNTIKKYRSTVMYKKQKFVLDRFIGSNKGLYICELEMKSESQKLILPSWIGKEVTGDSRYSNSNLLRMPYNKWNI